MAFQKFCEHCNAKLIIKSITQIFKTSKIILIVPNFINLIPNKYFQFYKLAIQFYFQLHF